MLTSNVAMCSVQRGASPPVLYASPLSHEVSLLQALHTQTLRAVRALSPTAAVHIVDVCSSRHEIEVLAQQERSW